MNLKELKQRARSEGVVGFSRMKKAELEKALQKPKSFPEIRKVFPENVAAVVDLSLDTLRQNRMDTKIVRNEKGKTRPKSTINHKSVFANHKDLVNVMEQV